MAELVGIDHRTHGADLAVLDVDGEHVDQAALGADLAADVMANGDNAVGLAKRLLDAAAKPALALTLEMELTAQDSLVRTEGFAQ
jgi:hypothetical protein